MPLLAKLVPVWFPSFPVRALMYFVTNTTKSGLLSLAFEGPLSAAPGNMCSSNSHCSSEAPSILPALALTHASHTGEHMTSLESSTQTL